MKLISIPEYGRIQRSEIGEKLLHRLQRFDEKKFYTSQGHIFDWNYLHYIKALNYVGVVQIPGLVIEILPKVDTTISRDVSPYEKKDSQKNLAQKNLLYMLSLTGNIPARDRDLANLSLNKLPLLEVIVLIFITCLLEELRKGLDSSYIQIKENLRYLKGKLLFNQNIRLNAAHNERVFVIYDELISDTLPNRIFKATCYTLLCMIKLNRTQQLLREAILYFSNVSDCHIEKHHFEKVQFNRNTERFSTLMDFCRIIYCQASPAPSQGMMDTFSLLFPMEKLFEEFIARFIQRNCSAFNLRRNMIHIQSKNMKKWLLRDESGSGKFRLKPDIVIDGASEDHKIIIDTKWKRLDGGPEGHIHGLSQADLYQLYAYANQYNSSNNILLYPKTDGISNKSYSVFDDENKKLRIETINLNRNLLKEKIAFLADLKQVIMGSPS
jgi:5-methylcytosine-specific restriction enzyme subunit McrC